MISSNDKTLISNIGQALRRYAASTGLIETGIWHDLSFKFRMSDSRTIAFDGPTLEQRPVDMVLHCPICGRQHVDEPSEDWHNPPHRSHLCAGCGHVWRPADVPTNGVLAVKTRGSNDSPVVVGRVTVNIGEGHG